MKLIISNTNATYGVDQNCLNYYKKSMLTTFKDQKEQEEDLSYKCMYAPYQANVIKTPIFISNSIFDGWQAHDIFDDDSYTSCLNNHTTCTSEQLQKWNNVGLYAWKSITSTNLYQKVNKMLVLYILVLLIVVHKLHIYIMNYKLIINI